MGRFNWGKLGATSCSRAAALGQQFSAMPDSPDSAPPSRKSTGRRLSWADEGPPLSARPIADEIPVPTAEASEAVPISPEVKDLVSTGAMIEQSVDLGILRQGNTYGIAHVLPKGATAAEVVPPLPEGVTVQVKTDQGPPSLWVELELTKEGRQFASIRVKVTGAEKPELLLHLEMKAMGPRDGRPSTIHADVQLLRCASQESISASSEASEWKRGGEMAKDDEQPSP